ncbi:MAG: CheY-like chemotaxis protein/CheY-specific phosphatase CheX [Colwellia sp.]|jgi:CheY-like chemotaxis protein/CheY-specific phosphatase CheX|uniref:response regulator n=1 Tax=Colwellia sp. Bg11-12 TaxID=2759817 RepID=UPI0015F3EA6C|nr:response regulator [Colwellia sp. Bg11-12]MBA6264417.1 response regulator [Colwellia sp. Bg11-12]
MSIDTIYKVTLHPFINESIASLKSMTSLSGNAGDAFMDKVEDFRFKGYAVCSDITGCLDGVIMMHHYPETAVAIGNSVCQNMFNEDYDYTEINEELSHALAEWGNTIVGRATDLLSRNNLQFDFSSPYFIHDFKDMEKYLEGVKEIVTVPITVEGVGRYYFNLLVRNVNFQTNNVEREQSAGISNPHNTPLPQDSKILLVDDSAMIRKALKRFLAGLGYENVIEADDGSTAVEAVKNEAPDFLFMDVVMTQMNGNEALKVIRASGSNVPVVMLSSVTDKALVDECQQSGVSGFIFKPIQANNGAEIIKDYLKIA